MAYTNNSMPYSAFDEDLINDASMLTGKKGSGKK